MSKTAVFASSLALTALLLAGCGGGGGGNSPGPAPPGATTTTTTTTTLPQYGAQLKVVNYNLFWWCVSGNPDHNPENHNEGCSRYTGDRGFQQLYQVIKDQMPFDIIGLSECIDVDKILNGIGLSGKYTSYLAPPQNWGVHDSGFIWSNEKFDVLGAPGADLMSKDLYGNRWLGYVRLRVKETGQTILYANTHGGLGHCGGDAGRDVYNNFMASITKNREDVDSVIVTGDFNCRPDELVMELIMQNFSTVHGISISSYDNIVRSNWVRLDSWASTKGSPSDHDIVHATLSLPVWKDGHAVPDPPSPGDHPHSGPTSKCVDLGCGNHDATCWCTPSCESHKSCCDDYKQECPHMEAQNENTSSIEIV